MGSTAEGNANSGERTAGNSPGRPDQTSVIERLANERIYTPIAVRFTEEGRKDAEFQTLGFLGEFHKYNKVVTLYNGIAVPPNVFPADKLSTTEIPVERVIDYAVLTAKKENDHSIAFQRPISPG